MLNIHFLGSGSKGNAALICYDKTRILLDCGFTNKEIKYRFEKVGCFIDDLSAVLISHEHRDHIVSLPFFARQESLPIYATQKTMSAMRFGVKSKCQRMAIKPGVSFKIDQIEICPFSTSHDARDPVGYLFNLPDGSRLGIATDLGYPTPEVIESLSGCDLIGLESNHDTKMLREGPYPWFLKQRIQSKRGHLSNPSAATLIEQIASDRLQQLFALHLSQTNNRPKLAHQALAAQLDRLGLSSVPVTVISQDKPYSYLPDKQLKLL
jgi:phosphoribosyl 1,2-cyclic phosphodiesterase